MKWGGNDIGNIVLLYKYVGGSGSVLIEVICGLLVDNNNFVYWIY